MGREIRVPVNPAVVAWAVAESGYSLSELAKKLDVELSELKGWFAGEQPTLTQFKDLSRVLRRPTATFLLPSPPASTGVLPSFRPYPGRKARDLKPEERTRLRESIHLQRYVRWLLEELEEYVPPLPSLVLDDIEARAREVRALLGVDVAQQSSWKSDSEAFAQWRQHLESLGVLVFAFPLGADAIRGFSIFDDVAPVIAVNTHWNHAARVFTVFHEFAHLLTRTDSACEKEARGKKVPEASEDLERQCERFAAAVLMPGDAVTRAVNFDTSSKGALAQARALASQFRVSMRAAVLRMIDLDLAEWALFQKIPKASDAKPLSAGGGGPTRSELRVREYGFRANKLVLRALGAAVIHPSDAMRVLDVGEHNLVEIEHMVA